MENNEVQRNKLYDSDKYDMYVLTVKQRGNATILTTDKRFWIEDHFGTMFHKKMFITHRKDLLVGDYLIDDRTKNGCFR